MAGAAVATFGIFSVKRRRFEPLTMVLPRERGLECDADDAET